LLAQTNIGPESYIRKSWAERDVDSGTEKYNNRSINETNVACN